MSHLSMSRASLLLLIVVVCMIFGFLIGESRSRENNRRKYAELRSPSISVLRAFMRAWRDGPNQEAPRDGVELPQ